MKSLKTILLLAVIAFSAVQCAKDGAVGPQGGKGENGIDGENGKDGKDGSNGKDGNNGNDGKNGNANVRLYIFKGVYNFASTPQQYFRCPSSGDSTVNSLWTFYITRTNTNLTFVIPGQGVNGTSDYRVRLDGQFENKDSIANWVINRNSGSGETYQEVRIFRVYANTITESATQTNNKAVYNGFSEAEVKQMNYREFCNNFGIKE